MARDESSKLSLVVKLSVPAAHTAIQRLRNIDVSGRKSREKAEFLNILSCMICTPWVTYKPQLGVFRVRDKILTKQDHYLTKVVSFFTDVFITLCRKIGLLKNFLITIPGREPFLPIKIKPVF